MKKGFVLYEKVIDYFNNRFNIPMIEILSFHLAHLIITVLLECGKTRSDLI